MVVGDLRFIYGFSFSKTLPSDSQFKYVNGALTNWDIILIHALGICLLEETSMIGSLKIVLLLTIVELPLHDAYQVQWMGRVCIMFQPPGKFTKFSGQKYSKLRESLVLGHIAGMTL